MIIQDLIWCLVSTLGRVMCFVILRVEYCAYPVLSTMFG